MKSSEVISGQLKALTDRADEAVTAIFELLNRVRREKEQGLIPDEDLKKLLEQFADAANDIEISGIDLQMVIEAVEE